MSLGTNLQYLRQVKNITQEQMAEAFDVSRQTISKWEMDQAYPEIPKLQDISEFFHVKIDELLNTNIQKSHQQYSDIEIKTVQAFRMARYVMITPNPEDDVNAYMDKWAKNSGLTEISEYEPKRIGWDFPFVSQELQSRFGLRGYVAAYILPDNFEPKCPGVEIASQETTEYAVITIRDPFSRPFELIPNAYKKIIEFLGANGFKENTSAKFLACYEHVYEKENVCFMDVYIHVDSVGQGNLHVTLG